MIFFKFYNMEEQKAFRKEVKCLKSEENLRVTFKLNFCVESTKILRATTGLKKIKRIEMVHCMNCYVRLQSQEVVVVVYCLSFLLFFFKNRKSSETYDIVLYQLMETSNETGYTLIIHGLITFFFFMHCLYLLFLYVPKSFIHTCMIKTQTKTAYRQNLSIQKYRVNFIL